MIRRFVHTRANVMAAFLFSAVPLVPATVRAQPGGWPSPGVEFDMKMNVSVSGGMSGMVAGMVPSYSAHGAAVAARLRIDIVDGALPPLAEKGDYLLFDTAGVTVVHPSKKEFVVVPRDVPSKTLEQIQAMGMTVAVGGIALKLDTIPGTDTVAGLPTRHYRTTIDYTVTLDGMGTSQQMRTRATSEYWTASVAGLTSSPLLQTSQISGGGGLNAMSSSGPFKELSARSDSLTQRMRGTAVRIKAATNTDMGMGGAVEIDMTAELSNVTHGPIAAGLFAAPSDYARGASPGGA
jgi:hypothetical protein